MEMPTPCPECGEIVEFDDMVNHPNNFREMVCESCHDRIEAENNSGLLLDDFGNKLTWKFEPNYGLLEISVNGEELTLWSCEGDPEYSFSDFMKIWKKSQECAVSKAV